MAYVSDYTFNSMSRIGSDKCCVDQQTIQDAAACSYSLQNFFASDCSMASAKELATTQPGVNYSGSMGSDVCGSNIDESSKLLIGGIQTNPRCRIDLYQRPFATVPFLGRGSVDPIMESQIQQGALDTKRRTVTKMTEKSYIKYHNTPLIKELRQTIQNPDNLIESSASADWVRGGLPSRELQLDTTTA